MFCRWNNGVFRAHPSCRKFVGLQLDETCRRLSARCIARVIQRASLQLKRLADGEPIATVGSIRFDWCSAVRIWSECGRFL